MTFIRSGTRAAKRAAHKPKPAVKPAPKVAPPAADDLPPLSDGDQASDLPALSGDLLPPQADSAIPPHVWAMLQRGGELAAQRLVELLASPAFRRYSPAAQRSLIDLALTRAYGLPIKRALTVSLSSGDADAVAASLLDLSAALPEHARAARQSRSPDWQSPQSDPDLADE